MDMSYRIVFLFLSITLSVFAKEQTKDYAACMKDVQLRGVWAVSNPVAGDSNTLMGSGTMDKLDAIQVKELRQTYLKTRLFMAMYEWLSQEDWKNKQFITELQSLWLKDKVVLPYTYPEAQLELDDYLHIAMRLEENPEKPRWTKTRLAVYTMRYRPNESQLKRGGEATGFSAYAYDEKLLEPAKDGEVNITVPFEWFGGIYNVEENVLTFPVAYTPVIKLVPGKPNDFYEIP
jgi:hypothetical protein